MKKEVKTRTQLQKSLEFFKNLFYAALAALLIKTFLIETSRVPTGSMEKTIMVGDFLFVNKFIYGSSSPRNIPFTDVALPYFQLPAIREPEPGDIVVFEWPGPRDVLENNEIVNYVKRCIAAPGDTIEVRNKVAFVNGERAPIPNHIQYARPNIPAGISDPNIYPPNKNWNSDNYGPLYLPKKGDVITLSADNIEEYRTLINRELGKIAVELRSGKVFIDGVETSEYEIKDDYYFMMGDNRDDSLDSRFWGFVPRRKVVGEAWMIYWSWNPEIPFSNFFRLLSSTRISRIAKLVH